MGGEYNFRWPSSGWAMGGEFAKAGTISYNEINFYLPIKKIFE